MTDSPRGMESSNHRIQNLIRTAVPTALLAGALAVAGCGGGGGSDSASAPAPVNQSSSTAKALVNPDGTLGLVGPAGRSTAKKNQFEDLKGKIDAKANHKTDALKHGVAAGDACNDAADTPT